jgi:N-acetylglucosaminyldiphosphoundecaprenol N-acetyl-beta-D-mannosaminyltransferase
MIDAGKVDLLGVAIDAVDYEGAIARIVSAAVASEPYGVSALAVHGVMTGHDDPEHLGRLNSLDLVTPDGQPVRWALNLLHKVGLPDRVYGPRLTLDLCREAAARGLPVFFYGSDRPTLDQLAERLPQLAPGIILAGTRPSLFGRATRGELDSICDEIRASGARLCFVGLGCPRQEIFVFENVGRLSMPTLAVGAAFGYLAGISSEPPMWMQRWGLQWLHRFAQDPKRLWRRYVILNPRFCAGVARQRVRGPQTIELSDPPFVGWA